MRRLYFLTVNEKADVQTTSKCTSQHIKAKMNCSRLTQSSLVFISYKGNGLWHKVVFNSELYIKGAELNPLPSHSNCNWTEHSKDLLKPSYAKGTVGDEKYMTKAALEMPLSFSSRSLSLSKVLLHSVNLLQHLKMWLKGPPLPFSLTKLHPLQQITVNM